jgi:hypothetical protein
MWRGVDQPAAERSPRAAQRVHDAARDHSSAPLRATCIIVDRNSPQGAVTTPDPSEVTCQECLDATRSPELLDDRMREAVHWAKSSTMNDGTDCRYAPQDELDDHNRLVWSPTITIDPAQVTCPECLEATRPRVTREHVQGQHRIDPIPDHPGATVETKTPDQTILHVEVPPASPRAAGGHVSGPSAERVGPKDGPFIPLTPPSRAMHDALPIQHIVIDGWVIQGDQFAMGSLQHDVNMGTVSITFVGVRHLETVYKHMLQGEG